MLKNRTVFVLGVWLIVLSILGLPILWKLRLYSITGLFLVLLYLKALAQGSFKRFLQERKADTFTQNNLTDYGDQSNTETP